MPQKKNPDVAELVRGKVGRVYGHLIALLTVMKSLPLTYNKDLQEDKEPVFDTVQTVTASLRIIAAMLQSMQVNTTRIAAALDDGFMTATEVADYLVRKGIPFRTAHEIVGAIVRYCLAIGKGLSALTLGEFRQFSEKFEADVLDTVVLSHAVNSKTSFGGTAMQNVFEAIQRAKAELGIGEEL